MKINRSRLFKRYSNACLYCQHTGQLTIDHVIPPKASEFGLRKRELMNNMSNMVPACLKCNGKKGNMIPAEFLDFPELLIFLKKAKYLSAKVRTALESSPGLDRRCSL